MRSGISFYNRRMSLNFLKRSWPLWVAYILILALVLPLEVHTPALREFYALQINRDILGSAQVMVYVSFAFCAVTAMVMFGYLYNSRSCGMMNTIPVRRETTFFTAVLTGLVPMLILDVVFFLIAAATFTVDGYVKMAVLWTWLGAVVMANVAYYGMAVFCAMLTGNMIVLPLVYVVLSMTAAVVENIVQSLLDVLQYGYIVSRSWFTFLSPPARLGSVHPMECLREVDGVTEAIPGEYYLGGMNWLLIYCIAGLVLIGLALLLYRRRRMETAGDIVAIRQLRPVFRYCMAVGCALVFAVGMYETSFCRSTHGAGSAAVIITMLPVGAFIGWFAAEMLMQKSLRVFRGKWKGYLITCCVLVALAVCCEADVFGYEKWVPGAADVESVELNYLSKPVQEAENIEAVTQMHRSLIANKRQHENNTGETLWLSVTYNMKDGSRRTRLYAPDARRETAKDPDSDVRLLQNIMNTDEVRAIRTEFDVPVTPSSIDMCSVYASWWDEEEQRYAGMNLELTKEQAYELYTECVVPDVKDGHLATFFAVEDEESRNTKTNTTINFETVDRSGGRPEKYRYFSIGFDVQTDSERCLQWLEENTEFEPVPLSESERPYEDYPMMPSAVYDSRR